MALVPKLSDLLQDFLLALVVFNTSADDLFPERQMSLWTDVLATFPDRDAVFLEVLEHGTDSAADFRRNFICREILIDILFRRYS